MNKLKKNNYFSPLVIFVFFIGISISIFLFNFTLNNIEKINKQEFEHLLRREAASIQRELDLNLQVLDSMKDFFNASTFVDREEFRIFIEAPLLKHKSIQALEWIPLVPNNLRQHYEK